MNPARFFGSLPHIFHTSPHQIDFQLLVTQRLDESNMTFVWAITFCLYLQEPNIFAPLLPLLLFLCDRRLCTSIRILHTHQ